MVLVFAALTFWAYRKGVQAGTIESTRYFDREIREISRLVKECRIIPKDEVQVPLTQGSSRHSVNGGYVLRIERIYEHRAVAEEILGRKLEPNEVVHHIFPNRDDNRLLLNFARLGEFARKSG